jgi:hypothetical protein
MRCQDGGVRKQPDRANGGASSGGPKSIRPSPANDGIYFGDVLRGENGIGQVVAHLGDIAGCSATDLRRTLRLISESSGGGSVDLLISEVPLGYFDEETSSVAPIAFNLVDDALTMEVTFLVAGWDSELEQAELVASVLNPFLGNHKMRVVRAWQDENYVEPPWPWHARIALTTRSRTLSGLYAIGQQAIALLDAATEGGLDRDSAGQAGGGAGPRGPRFPQVRGAWPDYFPEVKTSMTCCWWRSSANPRTVSPCAR